MKTKSDPVIWPLIQRLGSREGASRLKLMEKCTLGLSAQVLPRWPEKRLIPLSLESVDYGACSARCWASQGIWRKQNPRVKGSNCREVMVTDSILGSRQGVGVGVGGGRAGCWVIKQVTQGSWHEACYFRKKKELGKRGQQETHTHILPRASWVFPSWNPLEENRMCVQVLEVFTLWVDSWDPSCWMSWPGRRWYGPS